MDSLRSPLAGGLSGSPPRLDVADTVTLVPSFLPVNADDERRFNEPAASAQAAQFVEDEDRPTMSVTKGSAGMKWDTSCVRPERVELAFCLQVSQDVGFTYVPSEGSSVRFDPPNAAERSITFHKPYPDTFIHAQLMKEFNKKLKNYYGWLPDRLAVFTEQ